jgi:HEAT repeat protein
MREARTAKVTGRVLNGLVAELGQSDDFTRARIIEKLVSSPSKELVERVAQLLSHKNTSLRMDVLDILRKTGNYGIDAVIDLLYHPNEDIRVYGCEVLRSLKHVSSLPHLIEKVYDEDENVKNAAVAALGEFDDPRAVDVLLDVLHEEEWAAFSAIYSLARIGNKRAVPALMEVFMHRGGELSLVACEALVGFGDDRIVDDIIDFVHNLEKEKKHIFIRIIIEHGDGPICEKLVSVMGEDLFRHLLQYLRVEKRKSSKIINLLVHFRHPDSARAMLNVLKDIDPEGEEYEKILRLFMELHEVWRLHLAEYLSVEEYAQPVIRACGGVGCKVDDQLLLRCFHSSSLPIKREIMKQLGRITNGNGHRIIREAMRDDDGHIQAEAAAIAGAMSMRELTRDVELIAKKGFADVRKKALVALLRLDAALALEAINGFVTNGSPEDKKIYLAVTPYVDASANLPFLERLIGDTDERVRQTAIRVVGNFVEDERYLNLFETVLKSGDVPDEVLKVIGVKRLKGFRQLLMELFLDPLQPLWTRYHALGALAVFGDASLFSTFVGGLKDENNLIKIGSLKALSELHDKRAIPHIRPFTKSIDEDVSTAATLALSMLSRSEAPC